MPSPDSANLLIFYRSRLWALIWAYIAVIYLTLPLMRSLLRWLKQNIGADTLSWGLNGLLVLAAIALLLVALRRGLITTVAIAIPLAFIGILAFNLPIAEERVHFLQYGLLGLLVVATNRRPTRLQMVVMVLFVVAVGCVDELIQWWLPNRVGDWRDVGINALAGTLGVAMGISLYGVQLLSRPLK